MLEMKLGAYKDYKVLYKIHNIDGELQLILEAIEKEKRRQIALERLCKFIIAVCWIYLKLLKLLFAILILTLIRYNPLECLFLPFYLFFLLISVGRVVYILRRICAGVKGKCRQLALYFNFQDANSTNMEQSHRFHDWLITCLSSVATGVLAWLGLGKNRLPTVRIINDSNLLEFWWTVIPSIILVMVIIPSLRLLYLIEERRPTRTAKAVGHQWYWEYDYPDLSPYNSYMVSGSYRFLSTDNSLIITASRTLQMLVTSADVLHSWSLPALAVKADAIPGRVNKTYLEAKRPGLFFGQCSEICGSNHSFMPISVSCITFILNWYFESIEIKR